MSRPKSKTDTETPPKEEGAITKAEAIRRALAEGLTKYEDAAPFIKTRFGHDVTPGHFSASKSREKAPGEPAAKRGRPPGKAVVAKVKAKRGRPPKTAPQPASPKPHAGKDDILAEMEALKPLVESMGKEKAHRIIDLIG